MRETGCNSVETANEDWADGRPLLERWRARLHDLAPSACPPLGLICTCRDCIAPDDLRALEGASVEAVDHRLTGAYFGAAGGYRRDGTPVGSTEPAAGMRDEARFFFVKLTDALIDSVLSDDANSTILRGIWFVEPQHWHDRLLATGFVEALSPDEAAVLDGFFEDICVVAWARQSARTWDCVEYMGAFSSALPRFAHDLRSAPVLSQVQFWGNIMGGNLRTPAGEAGTLAIDLRDEAYLLSADDLAPLVAAFANPALGRYLHLAAVVAREENVREIALRALALWENSVYAMQQPVSRRQARRGG